MATRIQVRRGTTSDWSTANPVLAAGEIGLDTSTGNTKIGDGTTDWNNLGYQLPFNAVGSKNSALTSTLSLDHTNDRVGIGTTTPSEKLDVVGNTELNGTLYVSGNGTFDGDLAVNGGDITTSSSSLNIASTLTASQTINIATGVTTSGNTKTINIATGGDTGSTTNVNVGSASGGTLAVLKNATVAGTLAVTGVISGPGTIPIGGIIMWNGSSIPTGWQLCDGSNGTPDLRNQFVIGGNAYSTSAWRESITGSSTSTGGSKDAIVVSHTHAITDPGHTHTYTYRGATFPQSGDSTQCWANTSSQNTGSAYTGITINNAGSSGTNANLPPYFVLAFIQRMI